MEQTASLPRDAPPEGFPLPPEEGRLGKVSGRRSSRVSFGAVCKQANTNMTGLSDYLDHHEVVNNSPLHQTRSWGAEESGN